MESLLLLGITLILAGVLLIVLEVFVPSAGILSILAIGCIVAGNVFLFRFEPFWGWIGVLGSCVLAPTALWGAMTILPNTKLGREMMGPSGEEIAEQVREVQQQHMAERSPLLDKTGEALTDMRPSGTVLIEGERVDAIAVGGIIDRGAAVRVTHVDGLTIEVRAHESS
jgi:membrane-bound ClpP family serine protease